MQQNGVEMQGMSYCPSYAQARTHAHKRNMHEEFRSHVKRTHLGINCIVIYKDVFHCNYTYLSIPLNPLNTELNPICQ